MKVTFDSVSLRNFMSYGNAPIVFDLSTGGTTLILGQDLDNSTNGNSANGCGKSTIINAIVYGLFGKPISDISMDNIINNINKKNMEVIVKFSVGDNKYEIKRGRKGKGTAAGAYCYIIENEKHVTPANTANEYIEDVLGISYELFVRAVVFSASHQPFLELPTRSHYAANQTDIIEGLFGLTMLSRKAEELKKVIKDTEASLKTKTMAMDFAEKAAINHQNIIDSTNKRISNWEVEREQKIERLEKKLALANTVDWELEKSTHNEIAIQIAARASVEQLIAEIQREIKVLKKSIKDDEHELLHLEAGTCPYCKQTIGSEIVETSDVVSKRLLESKSNLQSKLNALDQMQISLDGCETLIIDLTSKTKFGSLNDVIALEREADGLQNQIIELANQENPHKSALDDLEEPEVLDYSEINALNDLLEHQKFLLKLLTKKDSFVRKALLDKNIPFLNKKLREYLDALGLPHSVAFTPEMTVEIHRFGTLLDFGNLSNGQKARVNIALSFAFRDVLERLHSKIGICLLDEVIDHGLDAVGVQDAVKLLKRKARDEDTSMFIISHKEEALSLFDRTIIIQYEKGFSSVQAT